MKTKLSILLLFVTLMLTLLLYSCGGDCAHEWGEWRTETSATCTTAGKETRTCTLCEETEEREIAITGHNFGEWETLTESTCITAGKEERVCKNDSTHTEIRDAALGSHSFSSYVSDDNASCISDCTKTAVCSTEGCNATNTVTVSDTKKPHSFTNYIPDNNGTCIANATKTAVCDTEGCNASHSLIIENSKTAHDLETATVDATCTDKGMITTSCKNCEYAVVEYTDALDHTWDIDAPTCERGQTCTVCGTKTPANSHSYTLTSTQEADCEKDGIYTYTCSGCSDYYETVFAYATGHSSSGAWTLSSETKAAGADACKYIQTYTSVCTVCNDTLEKEEEVYKHTYKASIKTVATCTGAGVMTYTCSNPGCSYSYDAAYTDAEAHSWNGGTTNGSITTYSCTNSGCQKTRTAISATNNTSTTVDNDTLKEAGEVELKDASIALDKDTIDGLSGNVQISADKHSAEEIGVSPELKDKIGDMPIYNFTMAAGGNAVTSFGGKVTVKVPYTLTKGDDPECIAIWYINDKGEVESIKATYSGGYAIFETDHFSYYTVTRLSPKERCALYGHSHMVTVREAACMIDGYTLSVCQRCGHSEKTNIVKATGHSFVKTTVNATCENAGKHTYACEKCEYDYTEKIPAIGHNYEITAGVAATCTDAGYSVYTCKNCQDSYNSIIGRLAHDYTDTVTEATCTTHGFTTHTCKNCAYEYVDTFKDAKGHDYNTETVSPSCYKDGYTEYTCERCGDTYTTDPVKGGHLWNIDAPTCGQGQVCVNCNESGAPATGEHNIVDGICSVCGVGCEHTFTFTVVDPTCTTEGYTLGVCSICGTEEKTDITAANGHGAENGICPVCGMEIISDSFYYNLLDSMLSGEFTMALDGGYLTSVLYDAMGYYFDIDDFFFTIDKNGKLFGYGAIKMEGYDRANVDLIQDATLILHDGTAYIMLKYVEGYSGIPYAANDTIYVAADYDLISSEYGMPIELIETVYSWFKTDMLPICLDIALANSSSIESVLGDLIERFFDVRNKNGQKVFTLDMNEIKDLNNKLYSMNIEELIDELFGEGSYSGLRSGINEILTSTPVELVEKAETYGISIDAILSALDRFAVLYSDGEVEKIEDMMGIDDISEFLDSEDASTLSVLELIYGKDSAEDAKNEINDVISRYASKTVYEIFVCEIMGENSLFLSTAKKRVDDALNRITPSLTVSFTTSANGALKSFEIIADDVPFEVEYQNDAKIGGKLTVTEGMTNKDAYMSLIPTIKSNAVTTATVESAINLSAFDVVYENGKIVLIQTKDKITLNETVYDITYYNDRYEITYVKRVGTTSFTFSEESRIFAAYESCGGKIYYTFTNSEGRSSFENYFKKDVYDLNGNLIKKGEYEPAGYTSSRSNSATICYDPATGKVSIPTKVMDPEMLHSYTYDASAFKPAVGCDGLGEHHYVCTDCNTEIVTNFVNGHNKDMQFTLRGDSCEDGVDCKVVCADCGTVLGSIYYEEHVMLDEEPINTKGHSICASHDLTVELCACGAHGDVACDGMNYMMGVYYCPECKLMLQSETRSERDGCYVTVYITETVYINETKIYSSTYVDYQTEAHNYETYTELREGSDTCEDGVQVTETCRDCGEHHTYTTNWHELGIIKSIDFTKYGAVEGGVFIMGCACGYNNAKIEVYDYNNYIYEHIEALTDGNGRIYSDMTMYTSIADGFSFIIAEYYTINGCVRQYGYEVRINCGDSLEDYSDMISCETYKTYSHTYMSTAQYLNPGSTSCSNGVLIYSSCVDCGATETKTVEYCLAYNKQVIDLGRHGSVCGGRIFVTGCLCGNNETYIKVKSNCDFDEECIYWNSYDDNKYVYTCAVTHPQCGFSYSLTYSSVESGCTKTIYVVIGLNCNTSGNNPTGTMKFTLRTEYNHEVDCYSGSGDRDIVCNLCNQTLDYVDSDWFSHNYINETVTAPDGSYKVYSGYCTICNKGNISYYDKNDNYIKEEWSHWYTYSDGTYEKDTNVSTYIIHDGYSYTDTYTSTSVDYSFSGAKLKDTHIAHSSSSEYLNFFEPGFAEEFKRVEGQEYDPGIHKCMAVVTETGKYTEKYTTNVCHGKYTYIVDPTCTQYGLYGYYCKACGNMSDSWEEEPQGHDWRFDRYTKTYYCTRCNLKNSNGADGSIVLEDASAMDNDADTLIVGYWNKDDIGFILNITLVLHTPESDGNDQILISGVKFKYSKEGSYVTFSKAEVEALARRLGYTPDQYDIRISFVPVGFESDLDYAITFN